MLVSLGDRFIRIDIDETKEVFILANLGPTYKKAGEVRIGLIDINSGRLWISNEWKEQSNVKSFEIELPWYFEKIEKE